MEDNVIFVKIFNGIDCSMLLLHMISKYEVSVQDTEDIVHFAFLFFITCLMSPVGLGIICGTSCDAALNCPMQRCY